MPVDLGRMDRALVVLASISPDIDGLPVLLDFVRGNSADSLELWSRFHHAAHNITFAIVVSLACLFAAKRRFGTAVLAFLVIHLHYICDIIGSRGPDGYQWPIPYLMPFSNSWQLTVPWQWALNAWPNVLISAALLSITIYSAWARGYSPAGLFSLRADQAFIATLQNRFGVPAHK